MTVAPFLVRGPDDLRAARAARARRVALADPVLDPDAPTIRRWARAFADHGGRMRVVRVRWRPGGPRTADVAALLRRVDDLELDIPSAAAARIVPQTGHPDALASDLAWMRKKRIDPTLCLHVGYPGDDHESLLEALRRACALQPRRLQVRPVTAPPGSWLRAHRDDFGLIVAPTPPYVVLAHRDASVFAVRWWLEICRAAAFGYNFWTRAAHGRERQHEGQARGCPTRTRSAASTATAGAPDSRPARRARAGAPRRPG